MDLLAALTGLLFVATGAFGVASPPRLIAAASSLQSQRGLYGLAAVRVAFGAVLILAAAGSRSPGLLYFVGAAALLAAIMTPFGAHRSEVGFWSRQPGAYLRTWGVVVMGLGLALVWAVMA